MLRRLSRKAIPTIALIALTLPVAQAFAQSDTSGSTTTSGAITTTPPATPTPGLTGTDPVPTSPDIVAVILSVLGLG